MTPACRTHRRGPAEGAGRWVVQFGRRDSGSSVITSGDEDPPVGQQGGGREELFGVHRASGGEFARRRVIQLGGWEPRATACEENAAVGQQSSRGPTVRESHRAGRGEDAGFGVIQLGRREKRWGIAARSAAV